MNGFARGIALALVLAAPWAMADSQVDWTGSYVGYDLGLGRDKVTASTSTVFSPTGYFASSSTPAVAGAGDGSKTVSHLFVGLGAGYDREVNNLVYGVSANWDFSGQVKREGGATYPCCAPTGFTVKQSVRTRMGVIDVLGRLGMPSGSSLFYVALGPTLTRLAVREEFDDTFATAYQAGSAARLKLGWAAGFGMDTRINQAWTLRAEYLHEDFGTVQESDASLVAFTPRVAYPSNPFYTKARLQADILRVGFNMKY